MHKFFFILLLATPGILSLIPSSHLAYQLLQIKIPSLNFILSENMFLIIYSLEHAFLIIISTCCGCYFAPKIGIVDKIPGFQVIKYSIIAAIIYLVLLYLTLTKNELSIVHEFSNKIGVFTQIFCGGIVTEICMRFGLTTFIA